MFQKYVETFSPWKIIAIGVIIRLAIMPFTSDFNDFSYWIETVYGIQGGQTIYGTYAFWYPPVWGYILSALSLIIGPIGIAPLETFFLKVGMDHIVLGNGTIANPLVVFLIKTPLLISDVLVGYVIYNFVKKREYGEEKARTCLSMWMFCPLVIFVSSIQGQFETICILFMILAVFFVMDDKYFLAGVMLSISILTKFYPVLIIPALVAYIISKNREVLTDGLKKLFTATAGFLLTSVALLAPVLLAGDTRIALTFLTSRRSYVANGDIGIIERLFVADSSNLIIFAPFAVLAALLIAYLILKKKENVDVFFIQMVAASLAAFLMWPSAPGWTQYYVLLVPMSILLSLQAKRGKTVWILLSVIPTLFAISGAGHYYPLVHTGLISLDTLLYLHTGINYILAPITILTQHLLWVPAFVIVLIVLTDNGRYMREVLGIHWVAEKVRMWRERV